MEITRRLPFVQLDVFSSDPLAGNQLAVFPDARGLETAQMQAIAREMNFSETTFILPREPEIERQHGTRVRIFTVHEELPFAGHPTLGTATVLRGISGASLVWLDLDAGRIPVRFQAGPEALPAAAALPPLGVAAWGEMRQRDPEFGARHEPAAIAALAGLAVEDLAPDLPIQTVSTGLPFTIVPVRSLEAMGRLRVDFARAAAYAAHRDAKFFYFVSRETSDASARLHARMQFYGGEDPATGSAAGCCAAWMVAHGVAQPNEQVLIEQGIEIRRPSRLFVRAGKVEGRITEVHVGGYCVEVARGELFF